MLLTCSANFTERLAKLKRGASPVAHVDEQVKDAQKLLRQVKRHPSIAICEMLNESRNARRNRSVPPALQLLGAITDDSQDLIGKCLGRI